MGGTVTALDVNEEVLACFWDLAAIEGEKRAEAASKLLDHLVKSQEQYINVSSPTKSSHGENASVALDSALSTCSPLVAYSIRRLHKGLTSGRKGARQGFALALTAALSKLNCFKPEQILLLVESISELSVGGGRDEFFGQLFGLGAIVRSQKLDVATASAVAEQAVALAHKKSFIKEAAATLITELAEKNPESMTRVLSSNNSSSSQLRAWLTAPCEQACPEALMLALRLWHYMPKELIKSCPMLPAKCTSVPSSTLFTEDRKADTKKNSNDQAVATAFFAEGHLKKLLPVLRATSQGHPRLHIVWSTLISLLLESATAGSPSEVVNFWNILVETDIFESASLERKYLGFALFREILPNIQIEWIPKLLTPNFMHCLATNASKKDSILRPIAQQCLQQLGAAVGKADPSARAEILVSVERHGNPHLVKILNSQKIEDLQTSDADITARVKQLKQEFDALVNDGESSLGRQKSVVGQLAGMAKRQQGGAAVVADILKFLVDRGLFQYDNKSSESFDLASHCTSLLISTADAVSRAQSVAQQQQQQQRQKKAGTSKDKKNAAAQDPLETVAAYVEKHYSASGSGKSELTIAATEESAEAYKTLSNVRRSLEKLAATKDVYSEGHKQAESLKHLTILLELHAVGHPATADVALASDLEKVVGSIFSENGGAAAPTAAPIAENENEDSVHRADALVDIILTIFSRNEAPLPSAPLRDAAERLFKNFAAHVTATGVDDLLQIVAKPLDEKEDDDEEDDDASDDEDMEDEESGSEEDEEESENSNVEINEKKKGKNSDSEEEDDAEDDDNDNVDGDGDADVMTDEQMFRMDAQLGAYFATMQKGRDTKKLRQELVSFKLRALACLEMIMKKLPESSLIISMASPLLGALISARRPSGDVGLSERLAGILRNQLPRCKPEAAADVEIEEEELRSQLKRALYLASRNEDKAIQEAASSVFLFLEKAAFAGAENIAAEFISAAFADFFEKKKTRLGRPFFQNLLRRLPEASVASFDAILDACGSARNEFIRQEAYSMLELAAKSVDRDISEILKKKSDTLLDVIVKVVSGEFTKKQRRIEALKAICAVGQALSSKGDGLAAVLGTKGTKTLSEALATALESNDKDAHLLRLVSLLEDDQAPEKKTKPAATGGGGAAGQVKKATSGAGAGKKRAAVSTAPAPKKAAKKK